MWKNSANFFVKTGNFSKRALSSTYPALFKVLNRVESGLNNGLNNG